MRRVAHPAVLLLGFVCLLVKAADPDSASLKALKRHFEYDRQRPFDVAEFGVVQREGVAIHDLSYRSPIKGMVSSYLVTPSGKGPFPVVLYGHWMMHGSPVMNRREFLEEAIVLAKSGAISLLIDAPFVRPGFLEEKDVLRGAAQASEAARQQVVDFRRGLDMLLTRDDVDSSRIAYVGHSFDAHVGAILAGVEKRIQTFVLMAGSYSDQENTFESQDQQILAIRRQVGDEKVRDYFRAYAWDDPVHFLPDSSPASIFLQFGRRDHPEAQDRKAFALFGEPKRVAFYDAGHALNAAATKDRVRWLAQRLRLRNIDFAALSKLPETK